MRSTSIRAARSDGGPARIVANLPYNIATALLVGWLTAEPWPPWYDALVLMFQREVAERIVAPPGSKTYGRLVGARRLAHARRRSCSTSRRRPSCRRRRSLRRWCGSSRARRRLPATRDALQRVTEAAFGQRRKMLRQSLKSLGVDAAALLDAAGIEPTARAEEIPVEGFVALADALIAAAQRAQHASVRCRHFARCRLLPVGTVRQSFRGSASSRA